MTNGLFLCLEGSDGTGKGTQHELLVNRLIEENYDVLQLDFPQYGQPSAELAELYLNNTFGNAVDLHPKLASLCFAVDRLEAKDRIIQAKQLGSIVLANRFSASNMAHQAAKFDLRQDRVDFFNWLHNWEHDIMGIPEPDQYLLLRLPAAIAQQRVLQKQQRSYTDSKLDGHEADLAYLKRAENTYQDLADTFPDNFIVVDCVDGDYEKSASEIHEEIWQHKDRLLTNA